eukprot:TRINITY_DN293_c0_g1_i1.p1 TRINITY_DN293_c0_g1~~TRINITY_DN293_c0_g1_i1.p1  ORF type:complete len:108 (-),score=2.00 TRINITY_DN293_c0_g1_i1:1009-1332(-)
MMELFIEKDNTGLDICKFRCFGYDSRITIPKAKSSLQFRWGQKHIHFCRYGKANELVAPKRKRLQSRSDLLTKKRKLIGSSYPTNDDYKLPDNKQTLVHIYKDGYAF